jgi:hypothetical protein
MSKKIGCKNNKKETSLECEPGKDQSKDVPIPIQVPEIFTYRKHSMDYFTRGGVILRTGFSNLIE